MFKSKVVESYSHMQSFNREYQLPQAYQYFENVRNFLVALEQLRLPGFEASDLEKVNALGLGESFSYVWWF